ncbi:MAG: hypothetical protein AAF652_07800 [Cyanobacteria bacterium P01_C01_bin.72]
MTEEQILNAITNACEDDTLRFQIIIQDGALHVYINRPTKVELDYQSLESKIRAAINNSVSAKFSEIWLYCRVLGEIEADWQSSLDPQSAQLDSTQMSSMIEAITDAVAATNSIVERIEQELEVPESFATDPFYDFEELPTTADDHAEDAPELELDLSISIDEAVFELDLQKYCFISNRRLLYAVLTAPKEDIAQLVDIFDRLEESSKRSQLPILEQYFEQSIMPNLDDFAPELQSWWTAIIMFDSDQKRQLAIWLSRYCHHPEQTRTMMQEVLHPMSQAASAPQNISPTTLETKVDSVTSQPKSGLLPLLMSMLQKFWTHNDNSEG